MSQKLAIRSSFLIVVTLALLVVISIFKIPSFLVRQDLKALGYDEETSQVIIDQKISKEVIDHQLSAENLAPALKSEDFNKDYLYLYSYRQDLSNLDFDLYDHLKANDYSEEELLNIFTKLHDYEIAPLAVFGKVDVNTYVNDCLSHAEENSFDNLSLSNDYLRPYEEVQDALGIGTIQVLVTPNYSLDSNTPEDLEEMSVQYAIDGLILQKEAAEAFRNLCNDMSANDMGIYAIGGYSPNNSGVNASLGNFNEFSTGLLVEVVDSTNETVAAFENSNEAAWLKDHAHEYGFILRYPKGKEKITGHEASANTYRYVGVDLATKIHESKLTMDEYCLLYQDELF